MQPHKLADHFFLSPSSSVLNELLCDRDAEFFLFISALSRRLFSSLCRSRWGKKTLVRKRGSNIWIFTRTQLFHRKILIGQRTRKEKKIWVEGKWQSAWCNVCPIISALLPFPPAWKGEEDEEEKRIIASDESLAAIALPSYHLAPTYKKTLFFREETSHHQKRTKGDQL